MSLRDGGERAAAAVHDAARQPSRAGDSRACPGYRFTVEHTLSEPAS
jgi:hypothetical protein